ncbi:TPA: hypothetical protein RQK93_000707 [Vibrio vulnificus]|nr:hypothetical protein [Vibrio vulnificus]
MNSNDMEELEREDAQKDERWQNCEETAQIFLHYLDTHGFDYLLFGSWARKDFTPDIYCQDLDIFCFNKSIEDFIFENSELDISLISHGQSSPHLSLTKLIINSKLKVDYVFPAYKKGFSMRDFEEYLYHSPLERESFFIYKNMYYFDKRKFDSLEDVRMAFEKLNINPYFHLAYSTLSMISSRITRKGLKRLSIHNYPELEEKIQHVLDREEERKKFIRESKSFLPYRVKMDSAS